MAKKARSKAQKAADKKASARMKSLTKSGKNPMLGGKKKAAKKTAKKPKKITAAQKKRIQASVKRAQLGVAHRAAKKATKAEKALLAKLKREAKKLEALIERQIKKGKKVHAKRTAQDASGRKHGRFTGQRAHAIGRGGEFTINGGGGAVSVDRGFRPVSPAHAHRLTGIAKSARGHVPLDVLVRRLKLVQLDIARAEVRTGQSSAGMKPYISKTDQPDVVEFLLRD